MSDIISDKKLFSQLDGDSGTTMAMALIVTVNDNRYLISTNSGDSQILWSNEENHLIET